jgi:hypothetical protein
LIVLICNVHSSFALTLVGFANGSAEAAFRPTRGRADKIKCAHAWLRQQR